MATPTLGFGSTTPELISFFAGGEFVDEPQEGGGIFAAGAADTPNIFFFGDTNDVSVGGDEVDIHQGGGGEDNLNGAGGSDFIFGGTGDDIVRGGTGDDVVVGGVGADLAIGGAGADVFEFFAFQFEADQAFDVIQDFEAGLDSIVVVGSTDTTFDPVSGIVSVDGADVISLTAGLDDLEVVTRENSTVIA